MRKGAITWEYIAAVILVLAIVIILIFGMDVMKEIAREKFSEFGSWLGDKLGR